MDIDPYVYPGTNILKNLHGIEDYERLQHFEAVVTANRLSELQFRPISGLFDTTHLQSIHSMSFRMFIPGPVNSAVLIFANKVNSGSVGTNLLCQR